MGLPNWVSSSRLNLYRRVKSRDIPILCEGHSQKLVRGDMALIDPARCEKCFPQATQTWPPPPPLAYPHLKKGPPPKKGA